MWYYRITLIENLILQIRSQAGHVNNTQFIIHDQHTQYPVSSNSNLLQDWIRLKYEKNSEVSFIRVSSVVTLMDVVQILLYSQAHKSIVE